ncbi:MFS transporter [Methylocapsa acidiphila]|uniref:MFS transporter n=1 Tax=Methylocapsa acidiphila TaxID=133552 RepID=UPI0003F4C73E|nr:MFS transporter [Methylocapsa acidiphila]
MTGRAAPLPRAWRIYAVCNFISQIGTWMQSTAQAWLVLELTGSSELLGLLVAIQYFPAVVLAIPAGKVADRWGRRNLLLYGQAAMAMLAGGLAAVVAAEKAIYPVLAGFALLLGIGNALSQPARIAMAATLAGGEGAGTHGRVRAAGMATLSFNLARILGPALAGFAIAAYGPTFAFAINALSFLPLLLFLAGMDADDRVSSSLRGSGRAAFSLLWTNLSTRIPLLTVAVVGVFAINVQTLVPAYARFGLGLDANGFGLLMGAFGVGACLGGFLQWRWPAASIWRPLAAAAALGLCLAALSATHRFPLAALILTGFGVCTATVLSSASAAVQRLVPDHLRNAATALQVTIVLGANPLGSALTGWMIELFGPDGGSAALGAITLAAVMALTLTRRLHAVGALNAVRHRFAQKLQPARSTSAAKAAVRSAGTVSDSA